MTYFDEDGGGKELGIVALVCHRLVSVEGGDVRSGAPRASVHNRPMR